MCTIGINETMKYFLKDIYVENSLRNFKKNTDKEKYNRYNLTKYCF